MVYLKTNDILVNQIYILSSAYKCVFHMHHLYIDFKASFAYKGF